MIWIFVCISGYFDSWSLCSYIIYSFVGSIVNLCDCCYLDSTRVMCVLRRTHYAWWCVSKATSCELWRDCYNSQGAGFGASQVLTGFELSLPPS
jgi:hypothetical protein